MSVTLYILAPTLQRCFADTVASGNTSFFKNTHTDKSVYESDIRCFVFVPRALLHRWWTEWSCFEHSDTRASVIKRCHKQLRHKKNMMSCPAIQSHDKDRGNDRDGWFYYRKDAGNLTLRCWRPPKCLGMTLIHRCQFHRKLRQDALDSRVHLIGHNILFKSEV